MFSIRFFVNPAVLALALAVGTAFGQTTNSQSDPYKAYSTIGLTRGETLRVSVANIGGTNGYPPDPCSVQMGFVNTAGVLVKTANAIVPAGQAAFLTINYSEGTSASTNADTPNRINYRPVVTNLLPPDPCRTVSTAEVFDAFFGRTHVFAVPNEAPGAMPPPDPDFGVVGVTAFDTLRLNVTNVTPSNELPPPCNVQMGFVDAAGTLLKTVNGTIDPGHTASVQITYRDALSATPSTNTPQRFNLRPLVTAPPDPCRITGSAELVDSLTGLTTVYLLPAVQSNTAPPATINLAQ